MKAPVHRHPMEGRIVTWSGKTWTVSRVFDQHPTGMQNAMLVRRMIEADEDMTGVKLVVSVPLKDVMA